MLKIPVILSEREAKRLTTDLKSVHKAAPKAALHYDRYPHGAINGSQQIELSINNKIILLLKVMNFGAFGTSKQRQQSNMLCR